MDYIYFFDVDLAIDGEVSEAVKIGYSDDPVSRLKNGMKAPIKDQFRWHAAIIGVKNDETEFHNFYDSLRVRDYNEIYYNTGPLRKYLEWLDTRAFAALEPTELGDIYAAPFRFPWDERARDDAKVGQILLEMDLPPMSKRKPRSINSRVLATLRSDSDDWHTPPMYIEAARKVLGEIDLDPASNPQANQYVKAKEILTINEDGLKWRWRGRVWLNPPYGGKQKLFVAKAIADYKSGEVESAIIVVNAHATDTKWFYKVWEFPVCFTHHRVPFIGGQRDKSVDEIAPTTGTAFVYLGKNVELFADEFCKFGPIVLPYRSASTTPEEIRKQVKSAWEGDKLPK
jgi:hypothetical protein